MLINTLMATPTRDTAVPWGVILIVVTLLVALPVDVLITRGRSGFGLATFIGLATGGSFAILIGAMAQEEGNSSFVAVDLNLWAGGLSLVIGIALWLVITINPGRSKRITPTLQP